MNAKGKIINYFLPVAPAYSLLYVILFFLISFLFSCTSVSKVKQQNLSRIYKRNVTSLNPDFVIYHRNDSSSIVYFNIKTKELLYSKKDNESNFMAKVMIHFRLLESFNSNLVIDSATSYITDICRAKDCDTHAGRNEIIGDFIMKSPKGKNYLIEITTTDLYRNQNHIKYINVDRTDPFTRQNFLVTLESNGYPLFKEYLGMNEKVAIRYNNPNVNHFICRFYRRDFPISRPPFAVYEPTAFDYQADSIFDLRTDTSGSAYFEMNRKGFYHFLADSSVKSGLTLFYFGESYPEISSSEELIAPLRYLTTKKEFTALQSAENTKEEVDKFWLNIGSNPERAKELIRQFYNRVQDANRFFTSYMEGWKTDRGMIYIVFGAPNLIYKNAESESWLYGEENNFMSISFTFIKVSNPFTDNDFLLERSPIYKTNYFKAVDSWREGRVFTTN